jgi:hypothetical protein
VTARTGPRQGRSASHATGLRPALDAHRPAPQGGIYRGEGEEWSGWISSLRNCEASAAATMPSMGELAKRGAATTSGTAGGIVSAMATDILQGLGPAAVPLAALAGAFAEEVVALGFDLRQRRAERVTGMVERAAASQNVALEKLLTGVKANESKEALFIRAVQAAADAVDESKLDTLARAFATGALADDQAVVDEAIIVVDTLAQLEAPHLRLLAILAEPCDAPLPGRMSPREQAWSKDFILWRHPGLTTTIDALVAKLHGLGLIYDAGAGRTDYLGAWWTPTQFGDVCVGHLLTHAGAKPSS